MSARTYGLLPGAGGSAWYWHRVVPLLRERGHEAIAVDLPADDDAYGLEDYVDVVVNAVGKRDDLVLVAQSMGGLTAPLVCDRVPVSELILVNAMIPAPGESGGEWWSATGQGQAQRESDEREGRDPDAPFDPMVHFLHDVPAEVLADADAHQRDQSGTPFALPWPRDSWPDVPTRVLSSRDDRLFPVDFQVRVAQERLGITPEILPGGHLVALSRPVELVDLLVD
ncbi:alpha/beta fold hydrolase [Cryptosporangium minutisporangium]|uniref:Alpha/beta fold hydrolase n=1 Tax=Cryptosporangium minutisporangium TaxID=113569 RepID=A0ABP6T7L8_9ACTN